MFYTDLINQMVLNDKDRLSIFDKNGPYLATKKVGKNNPKAEEIKADNEIRMEWNRAVDRVIVSGVSDAEIVRAAILFERMDYSKRYYQNKNTYIITGHTPTFYIEKVFFKEEQKA